VQSRLRQAGRLRGRHETAGVGQGQEGAELGGGDKLFRPGEAAAARLPRRFGQLDEGAIGPFGQKLTGLRRADAVGLARQKAHAQPSLQLGQPLRQGRLGQADRVGGRAHPTAGDDHAERPQVTQIEIEGSQRHLHLS